MDFDTVKDLSSKYLFQNYGRLDLAFVRGEGCYLFDAAGKKYLDAVAGIAVNCLGYAYPEWVKAMQDQLTKLVHVSNLYYVEEQAKLAQRLNTITPDPITRTLFVNSGAEANEGALKTAVRYTKRHKVLAALNGFHGRTSAALGATGQTKYQASFEPLISNVYHYYTYNDLESVKSLIDRDTAALMIEGIQGEGGVVPASEEFLKGVRDLCTDLGVLMVVDEVQTGMGRTGKWFCMDHFGIVPDIITTAKGLGAGMPIGAVMTTDEIAAVMTPGTHGTTFGGNPLVTASGCAVIDIISRHHILDNVNKVGKNWVDDLQKLKQENSHIVDVRGRGFLLGAEIDTPEKAVAIRDYMIAHGVLTNVCHGKTIRIIPPLIFSAEQKDDYMKVFTEALQ
ncbi:MAG: aspartate aminotransferase family protein [Candidatus Methanomethylophilus sp.]|nr:aspartate aminotransferase family protein [Methanomethylophilus sp.]MDD3232658.1 aspartate aminotransferase family protein [Methanomethylophilus sp.]MDD4222190.1 aspartate aminotransferase family protein [Methanomethylophilus sp.]MDD4668516.1 aspartate aminotransferase family protein [Methanomethylophilus sp.]